MEKKFINLFIFFLVLFINTNVKAADVSSNFTIDDVKACSSASCSKVYDETTAFYPKSSATFLVKINWTYNSSDPINNGDVVMIPFATEDNTATTTIWNGGTFDWSDIYDDRSNKIGQWKVSGNTSDKKIEIKFGDYAVGKTNLSGVFVTPKTFKSLYTYDEKIVPLTVGDKVINLKIGTFDMNASMLGAHCFTDYQTNNSVEWRVTSFGSTIKQLYMYDDYEELTDSVIYKDLIIEGSLMYADYNSSLNDFNISAKYLMPTNITDHNSSYYGDYIDIDSYFTRINQLEGETYNEFKSRIQSQVLTYGIYKDESADKLLFIINIGSQPNDYISYDNDFFSKLGSYTGVGDYARKKSPFTVTSEVADIIERANGMNNIVNGKVSLFALNYYENYPSVSIETPISNQFTWTYTNKSGKTVSKDLLCSSSLKVPSSASAVNGTSKLYLLDSETMMPIEGAKLKLQKNNNGTWEDVAINLVTDETGIISVSNLEDGEYRYVQMEYLEQYKTDSLKIYANSDLSSIISSFSLNGDGNISYATDERKQFTITYKSGDHGNFEDQVYTVYYGDTLPSFNATNSDDWDFVGWSPELNRIVKEDATYTAMWEKKVNLNVHYYISGTTTKVSDDVSSIVKTGDSYTTSMATDVSNYYEFVGTSGEVSGTVGEEDIEVIYYYALKSSILTVNYIEEETGEVLASKVEQNLHYGDTYTTSESEEITNNYTLKRIDGEPSGTVEASSIVVTYYYEKKDSKLDVSLSKTGTDEITSKNSTLEYEIKYEVNIEDYIGAATVTITDTLPYTLNEDASDLDGGTYNGANNTITWTEEIKDIDSYDNGKITITKNISIKYSNMDSEKRVMTNNAKAVITLDNNSKEVVTSSSTNIKVPSKITVKYIDTETDKELKDTIISEALVGESYSLTEEEFEGYDLIEKPETEVVKYQDEDKEYVYKYKKKVFNISTGVLGNGGTITGDEPVKYGEDSTKDKIKITADSSHYIGKVLVNNKEIKIKSNLKTLTLDNFKDIKENKEVVVIFNKILENPKTGNNNIIYYVVGGLLLISIGIAIYLIRKKIVKRRK